MRDMHIHTEFSCDSEAKIEDYILEANKKGISTICFTDHVDLNTNDNLKFKMTTKIGNIFVNPDTLQPFNVITGNRKVNLSKRKIKKLGNPILNKLNKKE